MQKKYIIITILFLISIFYCVYYVYEEYFEDKPIVTIKADARPHRIRPEKSDDFADSGYNPIYDNIKSNQRDVSVSKLTKLPEAPMKIAPKVGDAISKIVERNVKSNRAEPSNLKIISEKNQSLKKSKNDVAKERQYYVQVASARSVELAEKEYARISKQYAHLLKNLRHRIIRYKLKDRGAFFKLLIGPLNGPEHARLICKKLIQSKQSCIMKRI